MSPGTPAHDGDMLTVLTATSVIGTFSTLTVLDACAGQIYNLIYSPTQVVLAVTGNCSTPTASPTFTALPTSTPMLAPSATSTPIPTHTATVKPPPTLTATQTLTSTLTPQVPPTQTPTHTPTSTRLGLPTPTATHSATRTLTARPTATLTAAPSATSVICIGDCNNDRDVAINELLLMVNVDLGLTDPSSCPHGISEEPITIGELISAVNHALGGCQR